jgi:hypothetical protein
MPLIVGLGGGARGGGDRLTGSGVPGSWFLSWLGILARLRRLSVACLIVALIVSFTFATRGSFRRVNVRVTEVVVIIIAVSLILLGAIAARRVVPIAAIAILVFRVAAPSAIKAVVIATVITVATIVAAVVSTAIVTVIVAVSAVTRIVLVLLIAVVSAPHIIIVHNRK